MPRKPIDYTETHFYKIVCNDLNITPIYVGHTTHFQKRKWAHKEQCDKDNITQYVYRFINENGGWNNWSMILINTEKCENVLEARKRERHYIEEHKASLNKIMPYIDSEEKYIKDLEHKRVAGKKPYICACGETFRIDGKSKHEKTEKHRRYMRQLEDPNYDYKAELEEKRKQYRQQYYLENKTEINEKSKIYRDNHKEEKARMDKRYRENNVEKLKAKKKEYYERNKEHIIQKVEERRQRLRKEKLLPQED